MRWRQGAITCEEVLWRLFWIEERTLTATELKTAMVGKWTEENVHYAVWALVRKGLIISQPFANKYWKFSLAPIAHRPLPEPIIKAHQQLGRKVDRRERPVSHASN